MDEMLEKQQYNNIDYYNEPVNKWLREYLEQIGHGNKVNSDIDFANKCAIKYSRIRSITGGNAPVHANDIIVFSKVTGISADKILGIERKEVPDNLKVKTNKNNIAIETNMLSEDVCNEISKHIMRDGLFPKKDDYLKFIEYLILEKEYLRNLLFDAEKSFNILDSDIKNNELSKEELQILDTNKKDYNSWVDTINNNSRLKKRFNDLITDTKIRNDTRDFITRYIYKKLKEN